MKNKTLIITIISIIIIAAASFATYKLLRKNKHQEVSGNKTVIATYSNNGKDKEVILGKAQGELDKLVLQNNNLKGLNFNQLAFDQKEFIIKEIIIKDLAYIEAKKRKLHKDDDYKKSVKLFKKELLKQKLFSELSKEIKKEENLKENYNKLVKELENKQDIRISYVALKTKNEADNLHKILKKHPKSFGRKAKLKSVDKETAKQGGDLGFVLEDSLPKEIKEATQELKKNQISEPIKLADKYLIIKITDKRKAKIATFKESKEALSKSLSLKALQDFIENSLKNANISIVVK